MNKLSRNAPSDTLGFSLFASAAICLGLSACTPSSPGGGTPVDGAATVDSPVGGSALDASFLDGTWLSGCDTIGATSAEYCTTFSGADGFATRTRFYAASAACSGASNVVTGAGTYALVGAATTPADATKVNLVLTDFGSRFSILARDGAKLKFGKEDATHDGSSDAQRYARFMAESHTKGTCPF